MLSFINHDFIRRTNPQFSNISSLFVYSSLVSKISKRSYMWINPLGCDIFHIGIWIETPFFEDKQWYVPYFSPREVTKDSKFKLSHFLRFFNSSFSNNKVFGFPHHLWVRINTYWFKIKVVPYSRIYSTFLQVMFMNLFPRTIW